MKRVISLTIWCVLLLAGCQMDDVAPRYIENTSKSGYLEFFNYQGVDPVMIGMIEVLKGLENSEKIISNLKEKFGAPSWESTIHNQNLKQNGTRAGANSGNSMPST